MNRYFRKHAPFFSPWLFAAAIGLLCLIILVFAVNNLRREKRVLYEGLLSKGQALVHFAGAGTRASMMLGPEPDRRIQHLIEQAALEPGILYLAVVEPSGLIVAHSEPEMVGRELDRDLASLREIAGGAKYQIIRPSAATREIFEVVQPFQPFAGRRGMHGRFRQSDRAGSRGFPWNCAISQQDSATREDGPSALPWGRQPDSHLMLVGLDMTEQAEMVSQARVQIILMSVALLLVGVGGWLSLLAVQGYRVSQETLRQIRAFADLLISRLPLGIVATGPDGTLETCNQAAIQLTGIQPPAPVGVRPAEALPPELAVYFQAGSESTGEVLEQEISFPAQRGERRLEVSSLPIRDAEQAFMGRMLLLADVTEQRRLQQEVRRHDRLVALGKMAAGVAHEVRNPLSSIKGFATLLGSRFKENSKEAETARLLIREVERLNRSISELLDYARPLPLQLEQVKVERLLRDALRLIESDARALEIKLDLQVEPELPEITADPDRLSQVLLNLSLNSLQAMEQGGSLQVLARAGLQPETIEIEIRDTGSGMPPELLERIMDPYVTTKPDGTGLGLAMVQKIVDEHQGAVRWQSQEGRGTTVTVMLPVGRDPKRSLS